MQAKISPVHTAASYRCSPSRSREFPTDGANRKQWRKKRRSRTILWISMGRAAERADAASAGRFGNAAQAACKPGSVRTTKVRDGHSSGTRVTAGLARPTRTTGPETGLRPSPRGERRRRPYLVLLPVGFTVPLALPPARCALAAPFHPYPQAGRGRPRRAVCSLWHFPWGRPRRVLPGTVFPWSPDFPPPPHRRERPSGRLHPRTT